ncbi:MoxR family ATPase [Ideonella sp. 4Y16]|uniref:MoxR family ATPase n=1 Tax=Ideonella alba TaxID=2824118 RepID=A0A940Y6S8_9BURK|nr:MoxR family ATPase [Ideonella alba]MBQ0929818.1 MoxR family ATPase [Ideonella alba]MBQ0942049.1 MoxR family ATPase [Ideonella alba]
MANEDGALADGRARARQLEDQVNAVVVGQATAVRQLVTAVFARGHVLLQGDVGVGKTTLLRAVARGLGGGFARIEGSVDLMPNDLLYHAYVDESGRPAIEPGPLTREGTSLAIFFFNEINRARPQVHALLLRAMAERSVQAFNREVQLPLLQVFADRNRLEREETFEIASAARDRFMMEIAVDAPTDLALRRALAFDPRFHDTDSLVAEVPEGIAPIAALPVLSQAIQRAVHASEALQDYALRLWEATAAPQRVGVELPGVDSAALVLAGASPRGMSLLLRAARVNAWLDGRDHLRPVDVRAVFGPCIAHRLCLQPAYELRREALLPPLIEQLLARVGAP